jgi:hypothetical protein
MAEQLLIAVQNFFSDLQYPGHTISADQEPAGYEAWRVGTARRHLLNRWQATTANADHYLKVDCGSGVTRGATFVAIDRKSNHVGKRFVLESSPDNSAWTGVFDCTVPSSASGTPAGANGCLTDEGAWLKTFTVATARYFRLTSKAMGAGVVPQLTGVWLGQAYQPTDDVLYYPLDDDRYDLAFEALTSPYGWAGRSRVARVRTGTVSIKLMGTSDEAQLRADIMGLYARGFPAWICWKKTDRPTAALLGRVPAGSLALARIDAWPFRTLDLPFVEEQPA